MLVDYLFHGGRLTAFVYQRGGSVWRVSLGSAKRVEEATAAWRPLLMRGRDGREAGEALKKLVYAPLEKHLAGATVVLVSPDGVLGTVPFAALPGRKEGTYLIEDVAVAVVPVPSALPDLLAPVKEGDRLAPSLLVAGDIRYDPRAGDVAPRAGEGTRSSPRVGRVEFAALAATRAEVLSVKGSFAGAFRSGRVTDLRQGDATKKAVRKAMASVRYAHLATHGYFAPEEVKSALSGDGKARPGEQREVTGWHPLLLSGLALSGANKEPRPGEEDGILTALEVSEMNLSRLELAVLSACETGLGKVAGGQGILGLQQAFQVAGARTVVGSLWSVDDRATRDLMEAFYKGRWGAKASIPAVEALRRAQLAMLRADPKMVADGVRRGMVREDDVKAGTSRVPPYFWAAFVLSGDWR